MFRRLTIAFIFTSATTMAFAATMDPIACYIRCLDVGVSRPDCQYICFGER